MPCLPPPSKNGKEGQKERRGGERRGGRMLGVEILKRKERVKCRGNGKGRAWKNEKKGEMGESGWETGRKWRRER